MHTIPIVHDASLREQLDALACILRATRALAIGPWLVGYHVGFDLANLAHHARRLGVAWPDLDTRKYNNRDIIDVHRIIADDECEHVISRSLVSACRVYGIDVPEDDVDGADIATLFEAEDWAGIKRHCQRDVQRVLALARWAHVLPARYCVLDIETVADLRMLRHLRPVVANKTLKDPEKIAADLAKKTADQTASMALDPWASVPVVWCFALDSDDEVEVAESAPELPGLQASKADGVTFDAFMASAVNDSINAR
jgi:hypothetical protein